MTVEQSKKPPLDRLIADLEHFRDRIGMFVARNDVPNVQSFLMGFHYALHACGCIPDGAAFRETYESRGYTQQATGFVPQMEARGMDSKAMQRELIEIEVHALRREKGAEMAAMVSTFNCGEGNEDAADKMSEMFGPGQIDQMIRQGIHFCWMALPKDRKNADELERQVRRIVDRALKDFREDQEEFCRAK